MFMKNGGWNLYLAVFEPGGHFVEDEDLPELHDTEEAIPTVVFSDSILELSDVNCENTFSNSAGVDMLYEEKNISHEIEAMPEEKGDTASESGDSTTYSSDVPLLEPSKDPEQPFDEVFTSVSDSAYLFESTLSEKANTNSEGAYINKSADTGMLFVPHSQSFESECRSEFNNETPTPRSAKKIDLVKTFDTNDKTDHLTMTLDNIDSVEVKEVSVTPLHVIGACWEFGSMSSVHLPHKESSDFRSRTNTIEQQSYAGSHRDVFRGSDNLLARVFSNTIGSMEFGKKDIKEMSLTFLPNSESQHDFEFPKQSFCNSNSKNLVVVSTGVTLMFIAMFGLTNLQSSMNSEGGLGVYSLAMGFAAFMVGSLFSPVIVKRFRPKACLVIGCLSPLFYVIVNFNPTFAFFLPASFILGLSKVILWNAVSTYITEIGVNESTRKGKSADNVISRYFGIFFLTLQLAFVFGNLISSLILLPSSETVKDTFVTLNTSNISSEFGGVYIATLNETQLTHTSSIFNSTSVCGSGYCNSDATKGSQAKVDDTRKIILLGLYSCCIIISTIVLILFLDHLPNYEASYASIKDVAHQARSVFMMLFDGQFLLILMLCMYTIISNGFIIADILKVGTTQLHISTRIRKG